MASTSNRINLSTTFGHETISSFHLPTMVVKSKSIVNTAIHEEILEKVILYLAGFEYGFISTQGSRKSTRFLTGIIEDDILGTVEGIDQTKAVVDIDQSTNNMSIVVSYKITHLIARSKIRLDIDFSSCV